MSNTLQVQSVSGETQIIYDSGKTVIHATTYLGHDLAIRPGMLSKQTGTAPKKIVDISRPGIEAHSEVHVLETSAEPFSVPEYKIIYCKETPQELAEIFRNANLPVPQIKKSLGTQLHEIKNLLLRRDLA